MVLSMQSDDQMKEIRMKNLKTSRKCQPQERGSGSYPPKRPTNQTQSENAVSKVETTKAPSIKQVGPSPIVNDEKKKSLPENKSPNATNSPSIKTSTTELNKSTSQKPTTTKKTPSKEQSGSQKDEKKKSETSEKSKEKEDKRARSSSKSVKSRTDRSSRSKERRSRVSDNRRSTTANRRQVVASRPVYSNANRNVRGSRAGARSFRGARGRFPPPPERRYLRGGFRGRGSGVVSASSAYRSSYTLPPTSLMSTALPSFSRPPLYRPPPAPPTAQAMIDIRRDQREKEMMERMRQKEQEHKQREDMLRLEREKEKLKWERERLEREKLEIQQMRMQAAYERLLLTAGVKRAYEGLDPYASQQESKRASYGIQDSSPHNMEKISSSSRRTPTRSYPSGGRSSDSYHRSSGSRYEATPRSSRDVGKQSSSSFGKNSSSYKISSSRRSDAKSSRNSRYSPPPSNRYFPTNSIGVVVATVWLATWLYARQDIDYNKPICLLASL
uniref:Uncharacterized protein n=1 Tax=Romanomermis culicivorax TaxID=13658 RepID=A0A915L8H8_ROMCU